MLLSKCAGRSHTLRKAALCDRGRKKGLIDSISYLLFFFPGPCKSTRPPTRQPGVWSSGPDDGAGPGFWRPTETNSAERAVPTGGAPPRGLCVPKT
jgi:hypothetical protein